VAVYLVVDGHGGERRGRRETVLVVGGKCELAKRDTRPSRRRSLAPAIAGQ
jgi:hypothetical protein